MIYRWLTDLTVTAHFAFLAFVVVGGLGSRRWRWFAVPHLAAVAWAVYVELTPGLICPLTPLENYFASRAGLAGYEGSFIEHYLVPIIYPDGLTPTWQLGLAALVVSVNALIYAGPVLRHLRSRRELQEQ